MVRETAAARDWKHFPPDGIAVASNGGGDLLVLLPGLDELHLWQHETGAIEAVEVEWS